MKFFRTIFVLTIIVLFWGCSHAIKNIMPVETETKTGEVIQRIEPSKTGDREDVPVGVKPSEVVAEVKTATGAKVWVVTKKTKNPFKKNKTEVYQNKQAVAEKIEIVVPEKSWAWLYWTIVITVLLIAANLGMKAFLGFNPIALACGWVARILRSKK